MLKKVSSIILSALILCSSSAAVYADDYAPKPDQPICQTENSGIMPLYDNVSYVAANCAKNEDNKIDCFGAFELYSSKNTTMNISLMKSSSKNGPWTSIESWSIPSTKRIDDAIRTSTKEAEAGCYYYAFVSLSVKDSNGNLLETVTCSSNII